MTKRVIIYSFGTFILAIGVVFSVIADLGTAPINMPILVLGEIMNISFGNSTIIIYVGFIIMQAILIGKINIKLLLQLPFSVAFGYLVDFLFIVFSFEVNTVLNQSIFLILGILFIALGAYLSVRMNLIMSPPDGAVNELSKKHKIEFGKVKIWFDIACVVIAVAVSLIFLKEIIGVGIGTLLCALFIGKTMSKLGELLDDHIEGY